MKTAPALLCFALSACTPFYGQTSVSLGPARPANTASGNFRIAVGAAENGGTAVPEVVGPTLGFVFDHDIAALRRVPGIPGAASLGESVNASIPLANAFAAPQQDYAIGISASDQSVVLILLSHGAVTSTNALTSVPAAPDRIVFSPSGDSAAFYYRNVRQLIALNHIPQAPQIVSSWDLSPYTGDLTAVAIKDGGNAVLAGITQASGGVVLLLPNGGTPGTLLPMSHPAVAQFLWNSDDAVVADQAQSLVYLLKNVGSSLQTQVLSRPEDGLAEPDLMAIDRFARTVVVAHSGGASGLAIDLAQAAVQPFQCQCVISTFEPLNGDRFYRVSSLRAGQFFAMDASAGTPTFQAIGAASPAGAGCAVPPGRVPLRRGPCRVPAGEEAPQ